VGGEVQLEEGITKIPPVSFVEKIYSDPYGDSWEEVSHDAMLYGRHATTDVDEYLLVSAVEAQDGASIQLMVGLAVNPESLKVL